MRFKILQLIVVFAITSFCTQAVISQKQAIAQQNTTNNKDIQEIQKVWEKTLTGFTTRDIDSIMETVSPNYSRSIDGTTIDYAGFRTITETTNAEFFSRYVSCSVSDITILKSNITANKAVVEFEYQLYAFDKNSMEWATYGIIQGVTFAKENGKWKIITSGDKRKLY